MLQIFGRFLLARPAHRRFHKVAPRGRHRGMKVTEYRVKETQVVTDEALTRILNEETQAGWVFDGMTFVPNEASKRPKMAFVIFVREREVTDEG
jgi:hypothetical protein